MKKKKFSLILLCFLCFCVSSAFGFSTHNAAISRTFDKVEAVIGEYITVTVSFTNEEAYDLRGFYYTEQIPGGLSVNTISVRIDGSAISNYVADSGSSGSVYSGSIPYWWVIETPTDFAENNPIQQNSTVEIVYSITSSQAGAFNFDEFNWVGYYQTAPEVERAAFGHSEDTDKQTITFTTNPVTPVANFAGSPTSGMAPLTVNFTDQSTGDITEWLWNFGDTSPTNNEQNPTHNYDDPGIYTVSLTVTGPGGTDTETKTNYITVTEEPIPPVADFSGTPTTGTVPLEVSFTDTSTGEITGWSWDFDNNGTEDSTNQNSTYTYYDAGTFSVTLEVTGPGGIDTETKTNYITVTTPIQYNLTVNTVDSGSVTLDPAGGTYNAGTEVKLTPVPDTGWAFNGWSGDLSGYSNPETIVMNTDKTVIATFDVDGDADGISDVEEDAGPNGGDGNSDTEKDSDQANVATFHTQDGVNYVTLESEAGTTLADCRAVSIPGAAGAPSEVTFPYDFLNFTINGAGTGATTLILYLPAGANINTYWKYGSTPTNSNPHWYEFMYESNTQTGAEINGNKITLHFIDGQRGDDDIIADGIIIDQGGPGTYSGSSGGSPDDASGGGCFVRAAYGK